MERVCKKQNNGAPALMLSSQMQAAAPRVLPASRRYCLLAFAWADAVTSAK